MTSMDRRTFLKVAGVAGGLLLGWQALFPRPARAQGTQGAGTGPGGSAGIEVIDLTQPLDEQLPVYPGDPTFRMERAADFAADGFVLHRLELGSHAGTHIDAPLHFFEDGASIDAFPVETFVFRAAVIDLRGRQPRTRVERDELAAAAGSLEGVDLALLCFGWDRHWRELDRLMAHPYISGEAAQWLIEQGARAVGTDCMSIDETGGDDFSAHNAFLGRGLLIVENLTNLDQLVGERPLVLVLPLKLVGGDASPVRAVALRGV